MKKAKNCKHKKPFLVSTGYCIGCGLPVTLKKIQEYLVKLDNGTLYKKQ